MTDAGGVGEYSEEEIHRLLCRIRAEATPPAPNLPERPATQIKSELKVERELTVDEIMQKIQRQIAQDQPTMTTKSD